MLSTLTRYFLKRWAAQVSMGFAFFGGLLLAWEVNFLLQKISEHHASLTNLIPLLLTSVPWNVGLLLPMAAVLGGLLGTQYLSEGSEVVASQGLGHGPKGFLVSWAILSAVLMVCSVVNAHWLAPWASRAENTLTYKMLNEAALSGQFLPVAGEEPKFFKGDVFLSDSQGKKHSPSEKTSQRVYLGKSRSEDKLHIIQIGHETISHLISDKYTPEINKVKFDPNDVLEEIHFGFRFEDIMGKAAGRDFSQNGRLTDLSYEVLEVSRSFQVDKRLFYIPTSMRHLSTGNLFKLAKNAEEKQQSEARVELTRRFSTPLACCALLLLGVAIGISHPRFYRGGALVKSIGVIVTYFVLVKIVESWVESGMIDWIYISIMLPLLFLVAGLCLLQKKMNPQQHGRKKSKTFNTSSFLRKEAKELNKHLASMTEKVDSSFSRTQHTIYADRVIGRWTSRKWWGNFAGVLAVLLSIHVFAEFAFLASNMAFSGEQLLLFIKYWVLGLPMILPYMLPVVFLLAWVLTFSDASATGEWTALRAGGVSLIQWVRSSCKAWSMAILAMFFVEVYLAPETAQAHNDYYRQIKTGKASVSKIPEPPFVARHPTTLFMEKTGIFWYSEGETRWGFPLHSPSEAPSLLLWNHGEARAMQLDWNSNTWTDGPEAETLFPAYSLRQYKNNQEIPTLDLFVWRAWASNPERETLLWGRLLKWLAAPCLLFAALGYVFPPPRKGRGQALGYALILSFLFMLMQFVFEGAAKAGQFPPLWGVVAPMLFLLGFGLVNLRRLRT